MSLTEESEPRASVIWQFNPAHSGRGRLYNASVFGKDEKPFGWFRERMDQRAKKHTEWSNPSSAIFFATKFSTVIYAKSDRGVDFLEIAGRRAKVRGAESDTPCGQAVQRLHRVLLYCTVLLPPDSVSVQAQYTNGYQSVL